jgi:hypothetical protein
MSESHAAVRLLKEGRVQLVLIHWWGLASDWEHEVLQLWMYLVPVRSSGLSGNIYKRAPYPSSLAGPAVHLGIFADFLRVRDGQVRIRCAIHSDTTCKHLACAYFVYQRCRMLYFEC